MRSDNLRPAARWITPDIVGRVLALAMPVDGGPVPITAVPTRGVKPSLAIVETKTADPPVEHARQANEREAATVAPHAASPLRRKIAAPAWTLEEDERLRLAYERGDRIDHLSEELGRSYKGTISRARKLGFSHPRDIKGGFVTKPKWSEAEDALLRSLYGEAPTKELPARIGRSLRSIYQRAFELDLKHGYHRQWTRAEIRALRIGHGRGIALADVAAALGRNAFAVSKYATNHRLSFGRRPLLEAPITLEGILNLEDSAVPLPAAKDRAAEVRCAKAIRADQRACEAERLRVERAAAAERRRQQADEARAAIRAELEFERARRRAAKAAATTAPKPKPIGEAKSAMVGQTTAPAASREPALPAPPQARAHPLPARPLSRALGIVAYAERMRAAVELLRARHFVVRRYNPEEVIGRWQVTGQYGLLSNDELVELAVRHGLEIAL